MDKTILETIQSGRILVSDGAWGTWLYQKGLKPGECPELWCIERPEDVLDIAASYLAAGADMVETNSFGGNSFKLGFYGLADRLTEINAAAVQLSRRAAGSDHWVIASMGPTGRMLAAGDVTASALYASFAEQAEVLAQSSADAICIETMSDIEEASIAIRAARENTRCEVICTFTFERTVRGDYRTMMGVTPAQAANAARDAGADIIGANCGNGMEQMVEIVRLMRETCPRTPILVQANAGIPQVVDGREVYPETPAMMAGYVPELVSAGAKLIGGCCGTTPAHIQAIRDAVDRLSE